MGRLSKRDIRRDRPDQKSLDSIKAEIKAPGLGGAMSRGSSDPNDPRHRRGPQAEASSGLRFHPDDFVIDDDGRLRLNILTVSEQLGTGDPRTGGASGSRTQRFDCVRLHGNEATDLDRDPVMQSIPHMSSLADRLYWHAPVPADMDVTKDATIYAAILKNNDVTTYEIDLQVFAVVDGDVSTSKTPDATLDFDDDLSGVADDAYKTGSVTLPANTIPSTATWISTRWDPDAINGNGTRGIGMAEVWMEYST